MNKDDTQKTISELQQRVENLENQLAKQKVESLETPAEIDQAGFQRTLESFNRDEQMLSLNSAPDAKPDNE